MQPHEPIFLGLDTATSYLALALWSPERGTLATFCEDVGRDHARRIVPELDALLKRGGVARPTLAGIGVGTGPGSYTGLRVGIATAKGLARALHIPLSGYATLAAVAYGGLDDHQESLVALDARRGNIYAGRFKREGEEVPLVGSIVKANREEIKAEYPALPYLENAPPDAEYLARQAWLEPNGTVAALYL